MKEVLLICQALQPIYTSNPTELSPKAPHKALSLPLPVEPTAILPDLVLLVMSAQYQVLTILLRAALDPSTNWKLLINRLAAVLSYSPSDPQGTLLYWSQHARSEKKTDQLLLSTYSLILKSTANLDNAPDSVDAISLLQIRLFACLSFMSTSFFAALPSVEEDAKKLESFWDQLKKVVLLYFRTEGLLIPSKSALRMNILR